MKLISVNWLYLSSKPHFQKLNFQLAKHNIAYYCPLGNALDFLSDSQLNIKI